MVKAKQKVKSTKNDLPAGQAGGATVGYEVQLW